MAFQAVRGTRDIFAPLSNSFTQLENVARKKAELWDFDEVRLPTFEEAGLFTRSVGETTDIVEKEMYVFNDRKGRSLALRPEGTASMVRAYVEHSFSQKEKKSKFFYIANMFRAERPQAGRYREFEQIGFEIFGDPTPYAEIDLLSLAFTIFKDFGVEKTELHVNSLGCAVCRPAYRQELMVALQKIKDTLCADCQKRLERNPFRVLDCKNCSPKIKDTVPVFKKCADCAAHEKSLLNALTASNIPHTVNRNIVRGFDYYTKTVFEFLHSGLGAQSAICSGGRYDNLVESLGGTATPAVGLAFGVDRTIEARLAEGVAQVKSASDARKPGVFLALQSQEDSIGAFAMQTATRLRQQNIAVTYSVLQDSMKSQMRQANKSNTKYCLIIGAEECQKQKFKLKDLTGDWEGELGWEELVQKVKI